MLFSETYLYRAGCTRATSNALHDVITIIYIYFFSKSEHCHNTNNHSVTVLSKVSMIRLQSQSATKGVEEASEGALICSMCQSSAVDYGRLQQIGKESL